MYEEYKIILREFEEEFEDGMLKPTDFVYVLRENKVIIDWYYIDESQNNKDFKRDLPLLEKIKIEDLIKELKEQS